MQKSKPSKLLYQPDFDYSLEGILEEASCGIEITFRYKGWYCIIFHEKAGYCIGRGDGREYYNAETLEEIIAMPLFDGKSFAEALANGEITRELF